MDLRGLDKEWRGFSDLDIKRVKGVCNPPNVARSRRGGPPNRPLPTPQCEHAGVTEDPPPEPPSGGHLPAQPGGGGEGGAGGGSEGKKSDCGSAQGSSTEVTTTPAEVELRER